MANTISGGGSTRTSTTSARSSQRDTSSRQATDTATRARTATEQARVTDQLQTDAAKLDETRARQLAGADTTLSAPSLATPAVATPNVRRAFASSEVTSAGSFGAPASASADAPADVNQAAAAAPATTTSEPPDVVAARVNTLAETDPAAAATEYADAIEANPDPAYREELTTAAQPGLEAMGRASMSGEGPTEAVVGELSRASEAMHADGHADIARAQADGFARGVDAESQRYFEESGGNMPIGSPAIGDAFAAQVGSGNGANFAADVTSSFADNARAGRDAGVSHAELQRRENLTANGADGLQRGVETLQERFTGQGEDLAERSARLEEADERFGPHLSDEERAAAHAGTAEETARMVEEYDASAADLTNAVEATARAYDSVDAAAGDTALLSTARNSLGFGLEQGVQAMPAASATLSGQAAMADTVAAQAAGERTWLDTVADMGEGISGDTRQAAFASATQGAALLGAADYGAGGDFERAKGIIAHNAGALLDDDGQAAVNEALGQMDGAGDSAEAFTRFTQSLQENEDALGGPQVANALGAMGTILGKPDVISSSPEFGRYAGGASILASAAGLALTGPGDSFQENISFGIGAANVATDTIELLAPGTRLGSWASVGGRFLGAAGAGIGLIDAIGNGDAVGVASSGLALYGALALNPYAAVAAGLIEGGRFLWNVRQDNQAQNDVNAEYLRAAGLSEQNADFVGGIGNYGPPLLGEHGRQHSGIDDLNERIDYYRDGGGDYGAVLMLYEMDAQP